MIKLPLPLAYPFFKLVFYSKNIDKFTYIFIILTEYLRFILDIPFSVAYGYVLLYEVPLKNNVFYCVSFNL